MQYTCTLLPFVCNLIFTDFLNKSCASLIYLAVLNQRISMNYECHIPIDLSSFYKCVVDLQETFFFTLIEWPYDVFKLCVCNNRAMSSHIVGYPRMGPKRELKFALESFWDGKSSAEELKQVAANLRSAIWKQMADAGIQHIPSNTFSYYDQVLDTTAMLGAVPDRYKWNGGEIGFDIYFSMARGNASVPAMEMTKWFDTN